MSEITVVKYHPIKTLDDKFLFEYAPPNSYTKMAIISITFRVDFTKDEMAKLIENETKAWVIKYPITTMTFAYLDDDSSIDFTDVRKSNCFVCYFDEAGVLLKADWGTDGSPENTYYPDGDTANRFESLKYTKKFDPDLIRESMRKQMLFLKITTIAWVGFIPAAYEIINLVGPGWISIAACVFGVYKAGKGSLQVLGILPITRKEAENREIQRKKNHYYYHCERNPESFLKLMSENFQREAKLKFHDDVYQIKSTKTK